MLVAVSAAVVVQTAVWEGHVRNIAVSRSSQASRRRNSNHGGADSRRGQDHSNIGGLVAEAAAVLVEVEAAAGVRVGIQQPTAGSSG